MTDEELIPTTLQLRLMDIEYSTVTAEDIRQIYLEEIGQEPPFKITVYDSNEYIDEEEANGFNGTIIHVENDRGVNEAYTIARGTEDFTDDDWHATDWSYNIMGIFIAQNSSQYDAAEKFDNLVTKEITEKIGEEPKKIALGHSLGGNLVILLQLNSINFDKVYTVNAAPPTFYQLVNLDVDFNEEIREKFNVDTSNPTDLYNLDPDKLQEFAEEYYKTKGETIHPITTKQDILTSLFGVRGFFHVGTSETSIDAFPNEDVEGLAALFKEIPDAFVRDVQLYFAENFTDTYNEDGFEGFFKELTGIDARLIDLIVGQGEDLSLIEAALYGVEGLANLKVKIPEVTNFLENLSSDIPAVLDTLVKHEYLTERESKVVYNEYMNIVSHMQQVVEIIEQQIIFTGDIIPSINKDLIDHIKEILHSLNVIQENTKTLQEQFKMGVEAHKLTTILDGLVADSDISYEYADDTLDMSISTSVDGKDIKVNISSAIRMYTEGLSILEEKENTLGEMKSQYKRTYLQDYTKRTERIMKEVRSMEESPYSYQDLMGPFTRDTNVFHRVTKIDVHEDIPELSEDFTVIFEGMFHYIEGVITKEKELLQQIKESIEGLFEEDERIAQTIFGSER